MPYEFLPMQIIDGKEYTGATPRAAAAMLPPEPGIYIWTLQLARALQGMGDATELPSRLSNTFQYLREAKADFGQVGFYRHVALFDRPPPLRTSSVQRAEHLLREGHKDFSWFLSLGTVFQRPLYVGKAINLKRRLPAHFMYRTNFSRQVRDEGISFNQLAVTLLPLRADGFVSDPETAEPEDEAEVVTEERADADFFDEDFDEIVPSEKESQDKLICLAESLLIRNLQPIYNMKVD